MTALGTRVQREWSLSNATTHVDNIFSQQPPPKVFSISMVTMMMNRVISASSLLLPLIASANADGLLSSLRDLKTVEQKEGVVVMGSSTLLGAEVSDDSQ
jgi:hypothetical protein